MVAACRTRPTPRWALLIVAFVLVLAARPTSACIGDRDGDARVTVDELIRCVAGLLAGAPAGGCRDLPALISAVNNALVGCPSLALPTPTASPPRTATAEPTRAPVTTPTFTATATRTVTSCVSEAPDIHTAVADAANPFLWRFSGRSRVLLHGRGHVYAGVNCRGTTIHTPSPGSQAFEFEAELEHPGINVVYACTAPSSCGTPSCRQRRLTCGESSCADEGNLPPIPPADLCPSPTSTPTAGAGDCSLPTADCTLAETAAQAGVFIGVAIGDPAQADEQAVVPAHFNSVTAENAMKWGSLAPTVGHYDFTLADAIADFAAGTGVRLRGHTLLWRDQQPADLAARIAAAADPEQRMRALVTEHFATVVPRYRGRVAMWDVVNEPLTTLGAELDRNIFHRTLGPDYIAEAFRLAHQLDPGAELCLNEFLMTYSDTDPRTLALLALVRGLLADGVPLHAVGLQAHFHGLNLPPHRAALERTIRLFADLGVRVELTELDVTIRYFDGAADPSARQAAAFGDVAAACMAVPGCDAITLWGIHDGRTWLDYFPPFDLLAPHAPLLFDAALLPKPAYAAVRDAIAARP